MFNLNDVNNSLLLNQFEGLWHKKKMAIASYDYVGGGTTRGCPRPHIDETVKTVGDKENSDFRNSQNKQ